MFKLEGMVPTLCCVSKKPLRAPSPPTGSSPHLRAWRETLPPDPETPPPSAQGTLSQSPAFPARLPLILLELAPTSPPWSPGSAAAPTQVPVMPPHAVVTCLGPSPRTGPRRSMRDHTLSVRLPRGGKPPTHPGTFLRDSGQSGSANECPTLDALEPSKPSPLGLGKSGAVERAGKGRRRLLRHHLFTLPCIYSLRAHTYFASRVPGGRVPTAAPAPSCSLCTLRRADLVPLSLQILPCDPQPPVQSPCTSHPH